jgi:hypothetical protein
MVKACYRRPADCAEASYKSFFFVDLLKNCAEQICITGNEDGGRQNWRKGSEDGGRQNLRNKW